MAIIDKPNDFFNTEIYTGNAGTRTIDNGFRSDFLWIKARSATTDYRLFDTLRGTEALVSNTDSGQINRAGYGFTSLASNGFTLNGNASGGEVNANNQPYVAWSWKGNGTTNANNTAGTINSTVNLNTTSGFSIVQFTGTGGGATVGHGLGSVPKMIILKKTNGGADWIVYHTSMGNTKALKLNSTAALSTDNGYFNATTPTSTLFSLGNDGFTNGNNATIIAYCFAEKTGYSKFGSYTGTGSTDGPFIYTGFKPAFVLIKSSSSSGSWLLWDNKRSLSGGFNTNSYILVPSNNEVEQTGTNYAIDMVSNGFKLRNNNGNVQNSGETAIYMAFAENPLVANSGTDGVPATAR